MNAQAVADRTHAADEAVHADGLPQATDALLLQTMATTRAMRRVSAEPVPDDILRAVIEAATWAPTGTNAQAETFLLVTDRAVMARLAPLWRRVVNDYLVMASATRGGSPDPAVDRILDAIVYQRDHFEEIPALVVVCYDNSAAARDSRDPRVVRAILRDAGLRRFVHMSLASRRFGRLSEAGSVYPAIENLLLAARAHGLAACMTTWHLLAEADFKRVLGIPPAVDTFAVIPMGWPLGSFGPVRRKPVDTFIRRDRWEPRR
jgi:nitroreductase